MNSSTTCWRSKTSRPIQFTRFCTNQFTAKGLLLNGARTECVKNTTRSTTNKASRFYFTGEMVFPWMFDQYVNLKPLKEAAELLAEKADWTPLYDAQQLANNKVPVSCAVYADDMFVEMDISRETLAAIPNSKAWITNEYEHNGLRADGERILDKLIAMGKQTTATLK